MRLESLADFLEALSDAGELARVTAEVDPALEIAQLTDQAARAGGPALLFERVRGGQAVVVANLFGSDRRICMALGIDSLELATARGEQLTDAATRPTWLDRLKRGEAAGLERFEPKQVKQAPCQQVVQLASDVDLAALPALQSWSEETGRAITAGQLLTVDRATGRRVWQTLTLPVLGPNRLAVPLSPLDAAWPAWESAVAAGEPLAVAVVLGGSPLAMLLGELPLGAQVDPLTLAGFWSGEPLSVVPARSQSLEVPAAAEIVLEGIIDPAAPLVDGGRIVLPSGLYQPLSNCLTLELTAVTRRTNAAFPARVAARPPSEATAVDRLVERLLLPAVQQIAPEVVDLALPSFGARHQFLFVAIRKRYAHQARKVAGALWGMESLMLTKTIVLVDEDVSVRDAEQVLFQIGVHLVPGRDVFFAEGPTSDSQPAAIHSAAAPKLGLDATRKLPAEGAARSPQVAENDPATIQLLRSRWQEYGLDLPEPS